MSKAFEQLGGKAQRGSKPRCHLLTDGAADLVAARLTTLVAPFATVSPGDRWMPQGFVNPAEAEMDKAERLLDSTRRARLGEWWLPTSHRGARTPNFDIASTCTIRGAPGLLLIEAKAHEQELVKEAVGRRLEADASDERKASHPTIGAAIEAARVGLAAATSLPWQISRDSHYQMSNRFAWSWKLTELGIPVVLVYLGFLAAHEMSDQGRPLVTADEWTGLVMDQSKGLFPGEVWNRSWTVNGVPFIPLIRSMEQPLEPAKA